MSPSRFFRIWQHFPTSLSESGQNLWVWPEFFDFFRSVSHFWRDFRSLRSFLSGGYIFSNSRDFFSEYGQFLLELAKLEEQPDIFSFQRYFCKPAKSFLGSPLIYFYLRREFQKSNKNLYFSGSSKRVFAVVYICKNFYVSCRFSETDQIFKSKKRFFYVRGGRNLSKIGL